MGELLLRSKKFSTLVVQILDGEFALLEDTDDKHFYTDNSEYAFEILKLLREADDRGFFGDDKDIDKTEEILI